ncbi:hypothetical protein [Faecalibacterium prausnitzii]|uniref:hypothetical protein n=1 Tax=Faecalibacterium prausnitzii TaxID=853 RepID=UPI0023673152|nr:hypothetical protein [Faecalibacterium prausnitzii]
MQEEVNEKTISLCIKGGKITAQILKAALIKLLAEMDKKKQQRKGEKGQCKKIGKQSIKSLQKSGAQITNIVVTHKSLCQQIVSAQSWPRMNGFIMWRLPTMCTQPESGCVDLSEWRR